MPRLPKTYRTKVQAVSGLPREEGGDIKLADYGPEWHEWFLPGPLRNPLNRRWHWAVKMRWAKAWRAKSKLICRPGSGWDPTAPAVVTFMVHVIKRFDYDGLVASLKPILDGLAPNVIHSDSPTSGHSFGYGQKVCKKCPGVEIRVEHATGTTD